MKAKSMLVRLSLLISALLCSAGFMNASSPVVMKLLIIAWDNNDIGYRSLTGDLGQIGVPYQTVFLNNTTPDGSGNRLSGIAFTDSASGHGLYQGIIETDSSFITCTNNTCASLLSAADLSKINTYASQYNVRTVCYYGWPDPAWGLQPGDSGASYTEANPLNVTLTTAGAAVFSYLKPSATIPISGHNGGGIWAYKAVPTAAANETTTPLVMAGSSTTAVTHTTADGRETMALTMDNYPGYLHSMALSYGVVNWVTKGVFLGSRRVYLNPEMDDFLFGNRLYAPSRPECPNDESCPTYFATATDLQGLADWQTNLQSNPLFQSFHVTIAVNGVGSTWFPDDPILQKVGVLNSRFDWITHTWDHANLDCYTTNNQGACVPATLAQSQAELNQTIALASTLGITLNRTDMVTPFNGGLANPNFLQAAVQAGIQNIVYTQDPPSPQTGLVNPLVPAIFEITRRSPELFDDVSSPFTGAFGSWPDEYNAKYGPNGTIPTYSQIQTYRQVLDIESDKIFRNSMLTYEPYPLAFHIDNMSLYDGTHSMLSDLMDAAITKYTNLFSLPVLTLSLHDIAPILRNRSSFDSSGVVGVFTPGVSVVLTTTKAGTIPVTGACSLTVCSTYGGQVQDNVLIAANSTVTLSLTAAEGVTPASVSLNPTSVTGGTSSTGTVTLSAAAPSGGASVALSSNNSAATVPATVTVSAGSTSTTFTVTTTAVASSATATITANYNGINKTAALTITPLAAALSSVSLNPTSVTGGTSSTGTVTLSSAAPSGGISVALSSNNSAAAVPATVTVPAGSTSTTFTVTTTAVASSATATITAIYNSINKTAALTITPLAAALSSVSLNPTSVTGGTSSTGTVTLSSAAPSGGASIALSSNNSAAAVPAAVTVPAGSTSTTFTVTTTAVASSATATITATYNSINKTAALTITPLAAALSSVSLNPTSVTGGTSSTGTVTLSSAAPSGGASIALSSNNSAAAVPAAVTVPAGSTSTTFTVTTTAVASSATATITAIYNSVNKTAALTITPLAAVLSSVSLNPTSVTGGTSSTGTVILSSAAPSGGISVALSSNNSAATVPATVTVSAGSTSATFTVTTTAVASSTTVTITGSYNSVNKTAALTITSTSATLALSSVSLNPTTVAGGKPSTGTVTLSGPAPAGGIKVTLSTNNSFVTSTPASITIPAGATTGAFTVTTRSFVFTWQVSITASYNGTSKSATLTVTR